MSKQSQGYIILHRKMFENAIWFSEPFSRQAAWIDLLLLANHKQGVMVVRGNQVVVPRGAVGLSQETMAARWGWSRKKVKSFLNLLQKLGQMVQQKNGIKDLYSIVNYDKYQKLGTLKDTTAAPQKPHRGYQNNKQLNNNTKADAPGFTGAPPLRRVKP